MFTSSPFTDQNLRELKDAVQTDNRGCLTIGQEAKAKKYRVLISDMDQILLDPVFLSENCGGIILLLVAQ